MPHFTKSFTVECDASNWALVGILLQQGRPIAYESRVLTSAGENYGTPDKECLAIVHSYQKWRCYLEGVDSTCVTDHHPLTFVQRQPHLNRWQADGLSFWQASDRTLSTGQENGIRLIRCPDCVLALSLAQRLLVLLGLGEELPVSVCFFGTRTRGGDSYQAGCPSLPATCYSRGSDYWICQ